MNYTIIEIDHNGFKRNLFVVHTIEDVFDYIKEYEETIHMKGRYKVQVQKEKALIGEFRIGG